MGGRVGSESKEAAYFVSNIHPRHFLRDEPKNAALLANKVDQKLIELATARSSEDQRATLILLGQIGELCRAIGQQTEAVALLTEAVALARESHDSQAIIINQIRLATALQYQGEHDRAAALFEHLLTLPEQSHRGFVLQHFGKCLCEMGRVVEGIGCFEQALVVRQAAGQLALLTSTQDALALAHCWLEDEKPGQGV
jgi:tetratricopeptide (TPR) repeat protein